MCFPCRLTFGLVTSYTNHVTQEHGVELNEREKRMFVAPNVSSVLQVSWLNPRRPQTNKVTRRKMTALKNDDTGTHNVGRWKMTVLENDASENDGTQCLH